MKQTLDDFIKAASEVSRLARRIDEESAPYKRMALRPRLRERFKEFIQESGEKAGRAYLAKLQVQNDSELSPDKLSEYSSLVKEKGVEAGKGVLDKIGISQFTELKPDKYEDFIDEIGGI